jgi:hypothetical protein
MTMATIIDRKDETEDQKLLRRFVEAATAVSDATHELLSMWEAIEGTIGETPSDIPGYPYKESLDEVFLSLLNWKENAHRWAQDLSGSDSLKMRTIARCIGQRWPEMHASSHHSGGGIYGITIPFPLGVGGPNWSLFWGTANDCWGADVVNKDGEVVDNVESAVSCDHADLVAVARAIVLYSKDAIERERSKVYSGPPPMAPMPEDKGLVIHEALARFTEGFPASVAELPPPTPPDSIEQHPVGCPCSKCDIPF